MTDELLRTEDLAVRYGDKKVLEGVDLCVKRGELCGILGLNGSGKTTLLNAIGGLTDCTGKVICCGREINRLHEEDRAKLISFIHQRTALKDGISALEYVLYGLNPFLKFYRFPNAEQRESAKELLRKLGLEEKSGCDFGKLSEGQKQLVTLARCVMQNAPVMLMDEPDSALDYHNRRLLYSVVKKSVKEYGFGGLITVHDPAFALKYCDKIYVLSAGKIAGECVVNASGKKELEDLLRVLYGDIELVEHGGAYLVGFQNDN